MYAAGVSWADKRGRKRAMFALATAAALVTPTGTNGGAHLSSTMAQVIVQALPGELAQARSAVRAAGGRVTRELSVVNGFAADLPGGSGAGLGAADGV
ncbi:MAG: hypothetical protein QOE76_815, partial [Frankiales bacterium]|nr:hypothetical protein [Frankiales bacterium]